MQAYSQTIGPMVRGSKVSELETERCARLAQDWEMGIKNRRYHQNPVFKWHWLWIGSGTDDVTCVTYWNTGERPSVTQAEAAMEVNVSVFVLEQEEQGWETSLLGCATLSHWHQSSVSGTPDGGDEEARQYTSKPFPWFSTSCLLRLNRETYLFWMRSSRVGSLGFGEWVA